MISPDDTALQQPPVGIDLGTTYSVVAYVDQTGRPVAVCNQSGDYLTPSALLFDDDQVIVGKEAVKNSVATPDRYIECFKRDMGSTYTRRTVRGHTVPPEILSGLVLQRLKADAERRLGPIRRVVITVPAFFDESRRQATQLAGEMAGLEVLDIINEPTATAVAFGYQYGVGQAGGTNQKPTRILVYDLGGGTFDVTILEIAGTEFRTLATDGDVWLGGKDFDERLVNYFADQFLAAHGLDPRSSLEDAAQLWLDAQEVKHTLSQRTKATVVCTHAGLRLRLEVTRPQFEEMIRDLIERTETTTSLVIRAAGLEWPQIDRILLVGGSSRIPKVAEMLRRLTGKEPDTSLSPDEVVAHGAALYAGMLMQHQGPSPAAGFRLVNVNSHSLGVVGVDPKTGHRCNVVLIPKNTPLPHRAAKIFRTARANQRSVMVAVVEGESSRPDECVQLGQCIVPELPPGLPQGTPIEVEYAYAANGRISVLARVPRVRYSRQVEIVRHQGRNVEDLKAWAAKLTSGSEPSANPDAAVSEGQLVKRLDELYRSLGKAAAGLALPPVLARSQQSLVTAFNDLQVAELALKQAQQERESMLRGAEAMIADARLAQTRAAWQQSRLQAEFAQLVLGRDCVAGGICPPGMEQTLREAQKLRQQIQ